MAFNIPIINEVFGNLFIQAIIKINEIIAVK